MHRTLRTTIALAATLLTASFAASASAADIAEPFSADTPAPPKAGSCVHPTGDSSRAAVNYRWSSRTNAWRVRPAFTRVATTSGPTSRSRAGWLTQETEHTGVQAWYLVLDARQIGDTCMFQVRLAGMAADHAGWVDRDLVIAQKLRWQIEIDLSDRRVRMYRGTKLVLNQRVVIGAKATPTPVTRRNQPLAMYDAKRGDANDFTGTWQLATTAHSPADPDLGRIGIHGRGGASLSQALGSASSHGCVRGDNATVDALVRMTGLKGMLGVPVVITR